MSTETITWHDAAKDPPDADTTVLVINAAWTGDPVWLGYLDGDTWRLASGDETESPPTHWAHLPEGPK